MIWLLACRAATWTEADALAPVHATLDRDGDGVVTAAEYDRVAPAEEFARHDANHDGWLDRAELAASIRALDPRTVAGADPNAARGKPPAPPRPAPKHRLVWLVLDALRQEVLAKDPAALVPDDARMEAADEAGGFDTPETRALLAELEAASTKAGVGFPKALSQGARP